MFEVCDTDITQSLLPKVIDWQESHNLLLVKRLFGKTKGMSTIAGAHQQMWSTRNSSLPKKDMFVERLGVI